MRLDKVQCAAKAHAAVGFGQLSRLLVVLFAAAVSLTAPAAARTDTKVSGDTFV